jgi:DNA-directed RNA polymerase subunit RPC12/RpoP
MSEKIQKIKIKPPYICPFCGTVIRSDYKTLKPRTNDLGIRCERCKMKAVLPGEMHDIALEAR